MKKIFYFISIVLIGINVYISAWLALHGDLFFFPDQARDMLLLENTISKQPITLIGPRSLGIPGLFHGPLWMYLNVPAYIIGKGNPAVIGLFWVMLFVITIGIVYIVAKKLFNISVGLLSALLFSTLFLSEISQLTNPYIAVMLFPLFFYTAILYIRHLYVRYLLLSVLLLGLMIQSQMAFGGPILVVYTLFLLYWLIQRKKIVHIFTLSLIVVPLSTFILFDLRHKFLQLQVITTYLTKSAQSNHFIDSTLFYMRARDLVGSNLGYLTHEHLLLTLLLIVFAGYAVFIYFKNKKNDNVLVYGMFLLFYVGYWILSFLYKGSLWTWYHYQFIPVLCILFCSTYLVVNKKLFLIIFICFYGVLMFDQLKGFQETRAHFIGKNTASWTLYKNMAEEAYKNETSDFGYFVFEDDSLGYRGEYALRYMEKKYPQIKAISNSKKEHTVIFVASSENISWWMANKTKIQAKPKSIIPFSGEYRIEKYILTDEDRRLQSDPTLINNLFFR